MDWSGFAHGKGPSRDREKTDRRQTQSAVVVAVRVRVFELDPLCVVCLGVPLGTDEMHEVVPRSRTRRMDPDDRFNRRMCVRLHRTCHRDVTEHRIEMAFLDHARGVDGGLVVQRRGVEDAIVYRRGNPPTHTPAGIGAARRGFWTPAEE